ncbi:MAG: aspartate-semialdehyde dehydrogenase [Candidatus Poseidoniaceae archaeon]|jgi:aspartate-semialdehyde dehydrogenase|nr:aspartate-semialdehyde dehydrogenase [Candidatus Poseidoniaceae archaeon]
MNRLNAVILGASGLVGQRLQQRLVDHPWFEVVAIAGSPKTAGLHHSQVEWRLDGKRPTFDLSICSMDSIPNADIAFSALPSDIALQVEPALVKRGISVFSNASAFRRISGIPLVIPEVNPSELEKFNGHVCATNCTVVPVILPLVGLRNHLESVEISTSQALSGAGWELLFDEVALAGEVDPFIPDEEEKLIAEFKHLFDIEIPVIANCNRVAHKDGHLVHVKAILDANFSVEEIKEKMIVERLNLPSAPENVIIITDECPTRKKHLWAGGEGLGAGMSTVVGDIHVEGKMLSFSALSHNTVRGAAGGVILLAEFAHAQGYISK